MKLIKIVLFQLAIILSNSVYALSEQARGLLQEFMGCVQNHNYACVVKKAEFILSLNGADLDQNQHLTVLFYLRDAYFYLADQVSNQPTKKEIESARHYSELGIKLGKELAGSKFSDRKTFARQEIAFHAKLAIAQHESGEIAASKNTARHLKKLLREYIPDNHPGDQSWIRWGNMVVDAIVINKA